MRLSHVGLFAAAAVSSALGVMSLAFAEATDQNASPVYGVTIPEGYRQWELIAPS